MALMKFQNEMYVQICICILYVYAYIHNNVYVNMGYYNLYIKLPQHFSIPFKLVMMLVLVGTFTFQKIYLVFAQREFHIFFSCIRDKSLNPKQMLNNGGSGG